MVKASAKTRLRARGRRVVEAVAPTAMRAVSAVPQLEREVRELREQVAELRGEVAETRRLHQRVAELTDVVAEVLVPIADRDDARVQKALETFARTSF